jgi:ABC-2 type transport system permease protein
MIDLILKIFLPFKWFIEKMDADFSQFQTILKLKLTLDNRRSGSLSGIRNSNSRNRIVEQLFVHLLFGLFIILMLSIIKNPGMYFFVAHLLLILYLSMLIIAEFSTVLFDTTGNNLIGQLPVNGNTLNLALNARIFIYLSLIAFSIMGPSIILAIFRFGMLPTIMFLITIFLNVLFTLFLSNILYLLILQIASGEKLKNLLMYFQVFLAIFFMAGYQLGIRLIDYSNLKNLTLSVEWYSFILPPAFFSGFIVSMSNADFSLLNIIFVIESLFVPAISIYITGKFLSPYFNRKLRELEQGDKKTRSIINSKDKWPISIWVAKFITKGKEESSAFLLVWKLSGRDRLFLQTILPFYGYLFIIILLPTFTSKVNMNEMIESNRFILIIYSSIMISLTVVNSIIIGNSRDISWIYNTLPIYSHPSIFKGSIKAVLTKFFIPLYLAISIAITSLWGIRVIPDLVIGFFAIWFVSLLLYAFQPPFYPMSNEKKTTQNSNFTLLTLAFMGIAILIGITHHLMLNRFPYTRLVLIPVYIFSIWVISERIMRKKFRYEIIKKHNP